VLSLSYPSPSLSPFAPNQRRISVYALQPDSQGKFGVDGGWRDKGKFRIENLEYRIREEKGAKV
jgi:hypothetical protein